MSEFGSVGHRLKERLEKVVDTVFPPDAPGTVEEPVNLNDEVMEDDPQFKGNNPFHPNEKGKA